MTDDENLIEIPNEREHVPPSDDPATIDMLTTVEAEASGIEDGQNSNSDERVVAGDEQEACRKYCKDFRSSCHHCILDGRNSRRGR